MPERAGQRYRPDQDRPGRISTAANGVPRANVSPRDGHSEGICNSGEGPCLAVHRAAPLLGCNKSVVYSWCALNAGELQRWLKKRGCTFETHRGGSGHLTVRLADRTSQLPMHGGRKELGTRLVAKIKQDLGLK